MTNQTPSKHLRILLLSAIVTTLFSISPWGVQFDNAVYDLIMVNLDDSSAANDIVVVGIDEPSFQELKQQWPWPRSIHAQLVEKLTEQNASVIAFDLLFPEESHSRDDQIFAEAIRQHPNTLVGTDFKVIVHPSYTIKTPIEPILTLIDAGAKTGHVAIPVDADGFVRRVEPILENTPSLAYAAASLFADNSCCDSGALPSEILINFAGGTQKIQQLSYYQALEAPDNYFTGKLVFVGVRSNTASLPDRQSADYFATPLTRGQQGYTAGVMIHAFTAASLLTNSWNTAAPRAPIALAGLLLAILFAKFGVSTKLPATVLSGSIIVGAGIAIALWYFSRHNLYLSLVSGVLPTLAVMLMAPYYNFLVERKQKKEIRKAFSTYVNESIVKQIEEDPDSLKLGGKQVDGTVLFMDIAGFSGLTETESPEVMIDFINQFLSAMIEIGMEEGGTVERFLGDAVMLIWGAPVAQPDHAQLACRAAIRMEQRIVDIANQAEQRFGFRVSARIGVNSGSMTAGNIGGADRFCYTVLGDCVNLAARFEAASKVYGTTTIIGAATADLIGEQYAYRLLDVAKVKGREQPEKLYELHPQLSGAYIASAAQQAYAEGLQALLAGDAHSAQNHFRHAQNGTPAAAIQLMLQRCQTLIEQPLPTGQLPVFDISKG